MIGFQPLGSHPNFFRIVFANAWTTSTEMLDDLLTRIDAYGMQVASAPAAAGAAAGVGIGAAADVSARPSEAAKAFCGCGAGAAAAAPAAPALGAPAAAAGRRVSKSSEEAATEGVAAV
jgi:hypothetical protein